MMSRGRPLNTSGGSLPWGTGGRAIFVMDPDGRIYASNNAEAGEFHHSTLANGGPVAAAGELRVIDGRVEYVTSASGHYRPSSAQMEQLRDELERQGIIGVPIYNHQGPGPNNLIFTTGQR